MQLKYTSLQSNETSSDLSTDRTQRLSFTEVATDAGLQTMLGTSQLSLVLTKAEAAEYVLGNVYSIELSIE